MALTHYKHREEFIKQKLSHSFFVSLDLASKLRDNAGKNLATSPLLRSFMKNLFRSIPAFAITLCLCITSLADVTIKQRITMSGQKFESTKRIKGSRERTEQHMEMADPSMAAYMPQVATITQCDLKRRIQINDRNKLYFLEPFELPVAETTPSRPGQPVASGPARKGGTMPVLRPGAGLTSPPPVPYDGIDTA